jgi:hypothetical protein
MNNFQVRITAAGNETFGPWRERAHDDLVFALALACWSAQNLVEPEIGPVVLNPPWPADARKPDAPVRPVWREVFDDLGIDAEDDW